MKERYHVNLFGIGKGKATKGSKGFKGGKKASKAKGPSAPIKGGGRKP